jgi:hypothetical protein
MIGQLERVLGVFALFAVPVGGLALLAEAPGHAQGAGLATLGSLAKGEWTINDRSGSPDRKLCLRAGTELIQIKHRDPDCSRFIIEDGASRVTVQYTCPGNGYGRTSIRRETGALVQLQSEGIYEGVPFKLTAEARRTGSC